MEAPVFKKHIRLPYVPTQDVRNGITVWYRGECQEWEKPIMSTDIKEGQQKYYLPKRAWGSVYHIQIL